MAARSVRSAWSCSGCEGSRAASDRHDTGPRYTFSLETSGELLRVLSDEGATAIEVGVPFSDPAADGPVIQRAAQRALACGTSLTDILALLERNRGNINAALVLFSYYNPLLGGGPACGAAT